MVVAKDEERPAKRASLIWERLDRQGRGPVPTLTHDQIARAAMDIADAEGLPAVSMRHLADRLGVATMAVYRYVSSKDDIYDLMLDAAYAELAPPDTGDWRQVLRSRAVETRAMFLRHPWVLQVSVVRPPLTPHTLENTEVVLGSLDGLGLDVDTMMAAAGTVGAFLNGSAGYELAVKEAMRREGWQNENEQRVAMAPAMFHLLGSGKYPMVERFVREGADDDDYEKVFAFSLDCVIDGIGTRLGI
jgi:AcrR family transcriptional regulator